MSCENVVIEIDRASKCYHVYSSPLDRLKQFIIPRAKAFLGIAQKATYFKEFWSIKEVSLKVRRGEVLGLIGANGAGKSTLLQLISGVLLPTTGSVNVFGRVAALLELGAGFNPEFSGRENIFLNAALLGLTDQETYENIEQIIEFSGLSDFIDQPVKTYSSGMYVRLAFSIATSVRPDILIIDEALSTGDAKFKEKSLNRIKELRTSDRALILVSHALATIEDICNEVIWLNQGKLMARGKPSEVISAYREFVDARKSASSDEDV